MILSICGSRGLTVDVGPSALWEAPGGLAVTYGLCDGPLTFMLTEQEVRQLDAMLAEQLASAAERAAVGHRPCGKGGTMPPRTGSMIGARRLTRDIRRDRFMGCFLTTAICIAV